MTDQEVSELQRQVVADWARAATCTRRVTPRRLAAAAARAYATIGLPAPRVVVAADPFEAIRINIREYRQGARLTTDGKERVRDQLFWAAGGRGLRAVFGVNALPARYRHSRPTWSRWIFEPVQSDASPWPQEVALCYLSIELVDSTWETLQDHFRGPPMHTPTMMGSGKPFTRTEFWTSPAPPGLASNFDERDPHLRGGDVDSAMDVDLLDRIVGSERTAGLAELVREAGVLWWAFTNVLVVVDRPVAVRIDRRRGRWRNGLDGLAVVWKGGIGKSATRSGMLSGGPVAFSAHLMTPDDIVGERNQVWRARRLDAYGVKRFLDDVGAVEVHRDDWGALVRADAPGGEAVQMVRVVNSTPEPDGSFKDYWLRVPPDVTTARQAVAWTFGMEESAYAPQLQT